MIGMRFGRLIVLERDLTNTYVKPKWICRCDCGSKKSIFGFSLRSGKTQSCGCLLTVVGERRRRYTLPVEEMSEYNSWRGMKKRCLEVNATGYENYGGRGITIDKRWEESFDKFYEDMGPKPGPEYSLDRINTDGDYTPDNCRWSTPQEQSSNKRNCVHYIVDGERLTIAEIARKYKLSPGRLYWYVGKGFSLDEAIAKIRDTPSRRRPD